MQDYAEAIQAAIADYSHCLLCGEPCESFEMLGGRIRVCPCVEQFPGRPAMVAVNFSRWRMDMGPKLTMEDLAVAAHEGYTGALEQNQRWQNAVRRVLQKINDTLPIKLAMHSDGEVTVDVTNDAAKSDG